MHLRKPLATALNKTNKFIDNFVVTNKSNYAAVLSFVWIAAFAGSSLFLTNYENILNRSDLTTEKALYQGYVKGSTSTFTTNLATETPFGYFVLATIGFSALMFVKQFNGLYSSITNGESLFSFNGGEKVK